MRHIPINDLDRQNRLLAPALQSAIARVIDSGRYVLGGECTAFEEEFAAYCSAAHCVTVANGTDALELGLRAVGIVAGHRVATVANAGGYATCAIRRIGAEPVFVDVCESDRLMDLESLAVLTRSGDVDAVVLTHLLGKVHDMGRARSIADATGIPLVEDCAQAHGASRDGRRAGSVGHLGCFSFYPTKNLGALGDGGAIITSDDKLARRLVSLRQYGWTTKYRVELAGGRNSRLDEIQAAVLRAKLPHLDKWNARRRIIAGRYASIVRHPRVSGPALAGANDAAHLVVIETADRDALRAHLAEAGIASDVHYPVPDHHQPILAGEGAVRHLPVTDRLAERILTLPCFPELADDEVDRIAWRINAW